MRRLAAAACAALALVAVLLATLGRSPAQSASDYRVDAIFDTAKGIVPGQLVKIVGARVGSIEDVRLTPGFKARIQMSVDRDFAPFRSDARCEIRPEALIAENFVNCDPGTPDGEPLEGEDGEAPTVPLERTTVPVNLTDLFNIMNTPARQRFPLVLNTLGLGLSGRGEDLNEIVRRANPTLASARRALDTLSDQRRELRGAIEATDEILARLAPRRGRVQDFVEHSERVVSRTAERRDALAETVRRLPALLDAARPALVQLDRVAADGAPVLRHLRTAAPDVLRLLRELEPFAEQGLPALREIGSVATRGRRTVRVVRPVLVDLARLAREGIPTADLLNTLFVSLRDRGFVEGLLQFTYGASTGISRYDTVSHLIPAHLATSECSTFATTPVPGCSANFGGAAAAGGAADTPEPPAPAGRATDTPEPAALDDERMQALLDLLLD